MNYRHHDFIHLKLFFMLDQAGKTLLMQGMYYHPRQEKEPLIKAEHNQPRAARIP